jgi:hypothetical protein
MRFDLVGIIENNLPRSPGVPVSSAQTLAFPRGASVDVGIRVILPTGAPVDMTGGTLELNVKRTANEIPPRMLKRATITGAQAVVSFGPRDTEWMEAGSYLYDVWWTPPTPSTAREPVILLSRLILLDSATKIV